MVLRNLSPKDLVSVSRTCKKLNEIVQKDELWAAACLNKFGIPIPTSSSNILVQRLYKNRTWFSIPLHISFSLNSIQLFHIFYSIAQIWKSSGFLEETIGWSLINKSAGLPATQRLLWWPPASCGNFTSLRMSLNYNNHLLLFTVLWWWNNWIWSAATQRTSFDGSFTPKEALFHLHEWSQKGQSCYQVLL